MQSIWLNAFLAAVLLSAVLLALAMAGLFATPLILVATAIVALLTVFLHRWMPQPPAATTHTNPWPAVALGGVLIAASVLLWPPGEFAIGGLDPGVYFNAGASLARTGTFEQRDTLLADAGSAARAAVIQGVPGTHADLLPGFYWNDQTSSITPQFPFLLTIWTGLVVVLAGPAGGAAVPLITGLAALVCFYAFAQRILGQWQGVAATALLAVNGAFLWHSRTHYSEPLLLAFLFGGLWAALVWREERNALAGVVVGLSLGLLPVIKTEAVLLGPLAAAAVGLSVLVQRDPLSLTLSRRGREDRYVSAPELGSLVLSGDSTLREAKCPLHVLCAFTVVGYLADDVCNVIPRIALMLPGKQSLDHAQQLVPHRFNRAPKARPALLLRGTAPAAAPPCTQRRLSGCRAGSQ